MNIRILKALMLLTSLSICGCTASYKHTLEFNPAHPLRVAVLPFYQVDDDGNIIDSEVPLFQMANQPLHKSKGTLPAQRMMRLVETELGETLLDLVSPASVRAAFVHHGYTKGISYDYQKINKTSPKDLCHLLACDALLYGKLTDWSQTYLVAETVNSVGLDLELVRASDQKKLFSMQANESDGRGLTKGPTGYTDLVLEPLKGLRESVLLELARKVADKAIAPLVASNLPEFKSSQAPVIFGASHSAEIFKPSASQPLVVLMVGTTKHQGSFSIGKKIVNIPMVEVDGGHYRGEYFPLPGERVSEQPLTVKLIDSFGRKTSRKINASRLSLG